VVKSRGWESGKFVRERAHERARERAHERAGTLSSHAGVRSACQSFCNKFSFYVTQNQRKGGRGAGGRDRQREREKGGERRRWKWGADGGGAGRWGERDREATPGGGDNGAEGATVNRPAIQDLVLEQDKVSEKSVLSLSYTFIYRSLL
jgi:hypothetical protein